MDCDQYEHRNFCFGSGEVDKLIKLIEHLENSNTNIAENNRNDEYEIDLSQLLRVLKQKKWKILKMVVFFLLIGIFIAFGSKVEYKATIKLLSDSNKEINQNLGGLSGLAGLAGINLDMSNGDAVTPDIYPQIVQSLPYQLEVLNQDISFEKLDTTINSYSYFDHFYKKSIVRLLVDYTLKLPITLKKIFRRNQGPSQYTDYKNEIIRLNYGDKEILEEFKDRINIEVNSSNGIISLTSSLPDPLAAAELTHISYKTLEKIIIEIKIKKASENLEFIKQRYLEAESKYNQAQERLAIFNDRNRNVITSIAQIEQQRLQNEFNLAYDIYKGLAVKLEQAEIDVKEVTPQFTIVEPVNVPLEKDKPKRIIIIFSSMLIGFLMSSTIIIIKFYNSYSNN
jgi:hypothetical protein